jgi:hypothetical protein
MKAIKFVNTNNSFTTVHSCGVKAIVNTLKILSYNAGNSIEIYLMDACGEFSYHVDTIESSKLDFAFLQELLHRVRTYYGR